MSASGVIRQVERRPDPYIPEACFSTVFCSVGEAGEESMLSTTPVFDLAGVRDGWLSKTSLPEVEYMSTAR